MNQSEVMVGAHCPKCNVNIGLAATAGGSISCPCCGGEMKSSEGKIETHVIANSSCSYCGSKVGLMSVVGGPAKCPSCGNNIKWSY